MRRTSMWLVALWIGICSAAGQETTSADDLRTGHRLAIMVCAFCHVAAPDQARMPILNPPAPSLIIVASVSSTLGTDTAFFRSATPYWDRRLQPRPDHRIPCTRHRSRNDCQQL